MMLKKLSERQFADSSQCKCSEILIIDTISGDETSSRIVSDEEIEKKKLEAHYGFMAKIQEVLPAESSSIDTPLEQLNPEKPRLYEIPYDTSDPAKQFCPNGEETVTLEKNKDAKSHKTTKRYMPVEKSSASKKPERKIPTGHRFSNKKTTIVLEKTMTPRSCLSWKPTGRIFKTIGLRWVPTGKIFAFSTNNVDDEPPNGSIVDIPHIHACKQTLGLSAGTSFNGQKQQRIDLNADALHNEKQENLRVWLLKFLISKKPVPEWLRSSMFISSGLVLHQMTSDHNRSELGIHDHSNEMSSSKLVPKVDQLCSSCEMSKAKRSSFKSKAVPSSKGRLNLLHMDLCGPMRVASINGKKHILVIVDDYSRYTWTLFL
ncbi:hypothetical protein Tco_0787470 [Tanacetum coccineum]